MTEQELWESHRERARVAKLNVSAAVVLSMAVSGALWIAIWFAGKAIVSAWIAPWL